MTMKPDGRANPRILVVDDDPAVRRMLSLREKVWRCLETLSADDRNNHGLPWRVVEPDPMEKKA